MICWPLSSKSFIYNGVCLAYYFFTRLREEEAANGYEKLAAQLRGEREWRMKVFLLCVAFVGVCRFGVYFYINRTQEITSNSPLLSGHMFFSIIKDSKFSSIIEASARANRHAKSRV